MEDTLYPEYAHYTDVYRRDGLLARQPILAHCVQMTPGEWDMAADAGASVAHYPTSNTLLGSGTMPLDAVRERGLPYAICTDVGASPLAKMVQFLTVHAGRSRFATPAEALWRVTLGPAQILGLDAQIGSFETGKPLSYVVADAAPFTPSGGADAAIAGGLLGMPPGVPTDPALDRLAAEGLPHGEDLARLTADVHATSARLEGRIRRGVLDGRTVWQRPDTLE